MSAEVFVIQEGDKECILGKCTAQITMHEMYAIFVYTKTIGAGCVPGEKSVCAKLSVQSTESKILFYDLSNEPQF